VEVRQLYADGFRHAVAAYQAALTNSGSPGLRLVNVDLDTGRETRAGEYELSDETHAELLQRLAHEHFANLPAGLGRDLLAYFRDIDAGIPGLDADGKQEVIAALAELHSMMNGKRSG